MKSRIIIFVSAMLSLLLLQGCGPRAHGGDSTVNPQQVPSIISALQPDTVTVRIIGDVMLHAGQIEAARSRAASRGKFDFSPFLDSIAPKLRDADLAIAGMEFTLAGEPYTGYPAFSAPDSYADYIADCGVDVFLMANNHILDKGTMGLKRTLCVYMFLEGLGHINYTGCAFPEDTLHNPLIVGVKDQRIAIVNYTYGTNVPASDDEVRILRQNREEVLPLFAKARERGADFVIACPHWGDEYVLTHNALQEEWAIAMAEAGADAIIGAHPHVVQDVANIKTTDGRTVPVYYSIGNAVSNMSAPNTQDELMVTLTISDGKLLDVSHDWMHCYLPGQLTDSYTTVFM